MTYDCDSIRILDLMTAAAENLHNLGLSHKHKLRIPAEEPWLYSRPHNYVRGTLFIAGTQHFIRAENALETTRLSDIAKSRGMSFGYQAGEPNYGSISGTEAKLDQIEREENLKPMTRLKPGSEA